MMRDRTYFYSLQDQVFWALRNVGKDRRVWNRLGKLLRREGAEPQVSAMFYLAVVQIVLLWGAETWVLAEEMSRKMYGVHMVFLKADNGAEVVTTGGRDLAVGSSREGT